MNRLLEVGRRSAIDLAFVLSLLWMIGPKIVIADDPVSVPVEESTLPRGKGIATEVENFAALRSHPATLFLDDFEGDRLGDQWDEIRNPNKNVLSLVSLGEEPLANSQSLKVTAHLGKDTGGGLTKWFRSSREIYIRFYTRFAGDSDYIHHFVTLRANRGLTGGDKWSGFGGAGERPDGSRRFSTALEPWGNWGRWSPPGKWNFYSYWHAMKASPDGRYWGNGFRPSNQTNIPKEKWICCEFMLKHNTPKEADGEQAFWIDGELMGHWKGIQWRAESSLNANALTLESYVTDRWTKNLTNVVYFDDVVISMAYVGPNE